MYVLSLEANFVTPVCFLVVKIRDKIGKIGLKLTCSYGSKLSLNSSVLTCKRWFDGVFELKLAQFYVRLQTVAKIKTPKAKT